MAAVPAAVRKLRRKQISALSGTLNYFFPVTVVMRPENFITICAVVSELCCKQPYKQTDRVIFFFKSFAK